MITQVELRGGPLNGVCHELHDVSCDRELEVLRGLLPSSIGLPINDGDSLLHWYAISTLDGVTVGTFIESRER